jgi:hypothetical protein
LARFGWPWRRRGDAHDKPRRVTCSDGVDRTAAVIAGSRCPNDKAACDRQPHGHGNAEPKESILPAEVRATVRLYLDGKIDQWYVQQDQSGVVFVMNLTDPQEARALLDKLPLGQAGLMEFKFIQLSPISPLRLLLTDTAK